MHSFAQTNIQLFNQMARNGYSNADLVCILKAYQLAMRLFTGYFRADGKTFIAHLVGTASILAFVRAPVELVAAGLVHAAYMQGDFGNGKTGISNAKREQVKLAVGEKVEEYMARYTTLEWNDKNIAAIAQRLHTLNPTDRDVLLLRLANELEDSLDLGILYGANANKRLRYINSSGDLIVKMAAELGFANLATELARVFKDTNEAKIMVELRSDRNYSFQLAPESYQKRPLVALSDRAIQSWRFLGSIYRHLNKYKIALYQRLLT